jgi:hypothetical protein
MFTYAAGQKKFSKDFLVSLVVWVKRILHVLFGMKNREASGRKQCMQNKERNGKV